MRDVLLRRGDSDTHTHEKRGLCEDRGRGWGSGDTNQGCRELSESGRSKEGSFPRAFQGRVALLTPDQWLLGIRTGIIIFCCFRSSILSYSVMADTENEYKHRSCHVSKWNSVDRSTKVRVHGYSQCLCVQVHFLKPLQSEDGGQATS